MTTSTVNPLASAAAQTASTSSSIVPANMQISETDFLQLITTQMQDQDPLNPADPTQFLSQIEGLSEVSSLQSLQSTMQAQQLTSGASLLGQTVLAPLDTATLAAGGTLNGAISAPSGTSSLTVTIADSGGNTVSTFPVTPQASGLTSFSWDGTTSTGAPAPAGNYTVSVNATVNGASQSVTPLLQNQVTSVTIDPTTQALDVNTSNGSTPLSSVVSVY
ncbi:MAG: FlgD immunoglobulin-like domain containing protein [Steroidobacteraceae bacterium]